MDELKQKVDKWLATHGWRLEFDVADRLAKRGWQSSLGQLMPGADGNLRDADVLATRCHIGKPPSTRAFGEKCQVALLIECKHTMEKPWVLLGDLSIKEPPSVPITVPHASVFEKKRRVIAPRITKQLKSDRVIAISHGLVAASFASQAADPQRDAAFLASSKVADLASQWVSATEERRSGEPNSSYRICLPLVVIEGTLFRASFDQEARSLSTERVEFGHFITNASASPTRVDVCTMDGLDGYMDIIESRLESWARRLAGQSPLAIQ